MITKRRSQGLPPYLHASLLPAYIAGAAFRPLSAEDLQLYVEPWIGVIGQAAFYRQIAQMDQKFTDEIEPLYGKLPFTTRLIWGEQDQWIPLAQGVRLADMLKVDEFVRVPGAGHLVQEDAPEAIMAVLATPDR